MPPNRVLPDLQDLPDPLALPVADSTSSASHLRRRHPIPSVEADTALTTPKWCKIATWRLTPPSRPWVRRSRRSRAPTVPRWAPPACAVTWECATLSGRAVSAWQGPLVKVWHEDKLWFTMFNVSLLQALSGSIPTRALLWMPSRSTATWRLERPASTPASPPFPWRTGTTARTSERRSTSGSARPWPVDTRWGGRGEEKRVKKLSRNPPHPLIDCRITFSYSCFPLFPPLCSSSMAPRELIARMSASRWPSCAWCPTRPLRTSHTTARTASPTWTPPPATWRRPCSSRAPTTSRSEPRATAASRTASARTAARWVPPGQIPLLVALVHRFSELFLTFSPPLPLHRHTLAHGARQSSTTRHQKHPACPSLTLLLWMLVHLIRNLASKLAPFASCKKRKKYGHDIVVFFSSGHL